MGRNKLRGEKDGNYQITTWLTREEIIELRKLALQNGYGSFVQYITVALRSLISNKS